MADKKEIHFFILPEYEKEEQYLHEMALKGYMLESVAIPGIYRFKKTEPADVIYKLDFNPQKAEDRESYLQMYKDYGWEYLQDLNEFSYFRKPNNGNEEEMDIFSDNASRLRMITQITARKLTPLLFLVCFYCVFWVPRMIERIDAGGPVFFVMSILFTILILLNVCLVVRCAAGLAGLRKKYGEK